MLPPCPERQRLCRQVVCAWKPMADRIALTYRSRGEDLEDLRQVAALGLVKAVERYDPSRGNAFESFAVPTIVGEVKRHFRDCMWRVHVPRHTQELRNRVRTASRHLDCGLDEYGPPIGRIAEYTGLSEQEVRLGMEAMRSFSTLSLDASPTGSGEDGGPSLLGALGEPDPGFDHVVDRESVRGAVAGLSEREQAILYLRFFGDLSQSRIGERLGISQMHVSRLLRQALIRIREAVESGDPVDAGKSTRTPASRVPPGTTGPPGPGPLPHVTERAGNERFPGGPVGQEKAPRHPMVSSVGVRPGHPGPSSPNSSDIPLHGNSPNSSKKNPGKALPHDGGGRDNPTSAPSDPRGTTPGKTSPNSGGKTTGSGARVRSPRGAGPPTPGAVRSRSARSSPAAPSRPPRTPVRTTPRGTGAHPVIGG
ncbi:SigB/SigF/SigG family RNA polymerase sigma factor [Streptomyces sp. ST2-7A]|uniref:SigB/SigF/SigG family RNA polymerase sigma factor n=1 Tax=Streptomyces sp. ST2-7A TaxID=2907214 RepID=UPI0027E3A5F3|nr:SigB/SigF/SigG family RNA polymerase sigma factor [Streptomyces sp. ST2-7A]